MCKEFNFSFCLHEKRFLGLDNFNSHLSLGLDIFGPYDLSKGSFPDSFLDAISSVKQLPWRNNVIIVFVIPSIVVGAASFAFFLAMGVILAGPWRGGQRTNCRGHRMSFNTTKPPINNTQNTDTTQPR